MKRTWLLCALFSMVFSGILLHRDLSAATMAEVQQEAQRGGYRLIDVNELWDKYNGKAEKLLFVDTRQDWEYQAGHITGSVNFPMEPTWIARLTKRSALENVLGADKSASIIFY